MMDQDLQDDIDAGKVAIGGCCEEIRAPKWQCADCGVGIRKKDNQ